MGYGYSVQLYDSLLKHLHWEWVDSKGLSDWYRWKLVCYLVKSWKHLFLPYFGQYDYLTLQNNGFY